MSDINKGKSPFYPGQPVPVEFFTGRMNEINRIARAIGQVEQGKQQVIFLTGEYGIGKSSLAGFIKQYAETNHNLLGIHVILGDAENPDDVATKTVESILKDRLYRTTPIEKIGNVLSKYIGQQEVLGFKINLDVLKADGPSLSHGFLPFLSELLKRVSNEGVKGIMLILDEINGITKNSRFAHFIKTLVDENALSRTPLPLLLMLCGIEERRREMIQCHQPVERIFDIVQIDKMSNKEMETFFNTTFNSVRMSVEKEAMQALYHYSDGFPKIMQIIGDAIFWIDKDNIVDENDTIDGINIAVREVGVKFVDAQVLKTLRSKDYQSILKKLSKIDFDLSFHVSTVEEKLTENEKGKLYNFLQKMKDLNVLRSGSIKGEYVFNSRLVRLYMMLSDVVDKYGEN